MMKGEGNLRSRAPQHVTSFISSGMGTNRLSANEGEAGHEAEPHASYVAERACNARPTTQICASRACYGEHHATAWQGACSFCTRRDRPTLTIRLPIVWSIRGMG